MERADKIRLILKSIEKVRPYLQRDGGDVEFVRLDENNVVYVKVYGACVGCLSLDQTLKDGVMSLIMDEVPEITDVRLAEIEGPKNQTTIEDEFKQIHEEASVDLEAK